MIRKVNWKLALALALLPASASAQTPLSTGFGRAVSVSLGYSYLTLPIPSATRIDLNGVGASISADIRPRLGVKLDLNYARQANIFGTGRHTDVLSAMIGPVFYPVSNDRFIVFVQGLAGASKVTGVIPGAAGGFDTAYTDAFSWAMGGGIETRISSSLAVRTEADYLRTTFTDASTAFIGQSDLRLVGSLVYHWGWHWVGKGNRRRFLPF